MPLFDNFLLVVISLIFLKFNIRLFCLIIHYYYLLVIDTRRPRGWGANGETLSPNVLRNSTWAVCFNHW